MKIRTLIALSLLVACGDETTNDTAAGGDTGTAAASRLAPFDLARAPAAEVREDAQPAVRSGRAARLAPETRAQGKQVAQAPRLDATPKAVDKADGAQEVTPSGPRYAPLPAEPTDEDLALLTIATDSGGDGTVDRVQRHWFDAHHNKVMLEEDRDGDGVFEVLEVYFQLFDEGRLVRLETDVDANGTIDKLESRTYDADGRILNIQKDEDGDSAWDRVETNTWDEQGRRVAWTVDAPFDGQPEMIQRWDFDASGRALARSLDRYANGELVNRTEYAHQVDENGRVISMSVDGPTQTNEISRQYDESGRLSVAFTDTGRDGTIDSATRYTYDADGRLARLEIDSGNDGQPETVITRTYENWPTPQSGGCP